MSGRAATLPSVSPLALAAVITALTVVLAIGLGLMLVYTLYETTPKQAWADLLEPSRRRAFRRKHPDEHATYRRMALVHGWADMVDLLDRGWTSPRLHDLHEAEDDRRFFAQTAPFTPAAGHKPGRCPCRRCDPNQPRAWHTYDLVRTLNGDAFAAYWSHLAVIPDGQEPADLQRRYDACSELAPLTILAGLTAAEAADLAAGGHLDHGTLTAMAALRNNSVR